MKTIIFALLAVIAFIDPALAQFSTQSAPQTVPGTTVDIAPLANAVIQLAASALTVIAIPLLWAWWRKKEKELQLEGLKIEQQYREAIDKGAIAAIGAAQSQLVVQPGRLTLDIKNEIAANAANILAENFGKSIQALGAKDTLEKARQVVESRLGLTEANAAGAPVVGVTTPSVIATNTEKAKETL
jgi:hypothetical protein